MLHKLSHTITANRWCTKRQSGQQKINPLRQIRVEKQSKTDKLWVQYETTRATRQEHITERAKRTTRFMSSYWKSSSSSTVFRVNIQSAAIQKKLFAMTLFWYKLL